MVFLKDKFVEHLEMALWGQRGKEITANKPRGKESLKKYINTANTEERVGSWHI